MNPLRSVWNRLPRPGVAVLMYHRIDDVVADPWGLAVSPENFDEQLSVLSKNFNVLSVPELCTRLKQGRLGRRQICISFDDGYRDNFTHAKPSLESHNLPASFFIPSYFIEKQKPFWWDELLYTLLFSEQLPSKLTVNAGDKTFRAEFENQGRLTSNQRQAHQEWRSSTVPQTPQALFYRELCDGLRPMSINNIEDCLDRLKSQVNGNVSVPNEDWPMGKPEVLQLAQNPLFSIGLHTHTHAALSACSEEDQRQEIEKNFKIMTEEWGVAPFGLAYPYGMHNDTVVSLAKKLGIPLAFTVNQNIVRQHAKPLQLGRFQVPNLNGKAFYRWLNSRFHS